jgi:hypothetical protein
MARRGRAGERQPSMIERETGAAPDPGDRAEASGPADPDAGLRREPEDWTTGDEPMTSAQASYLRTLATEAGETFDEELTKAEASRRIDELQARTGRGRQG